MDDLIYFLLLIGWLAFSFYQQSVKKKKKLEKMNADREQQAREEESTDYEEIATSERQETASMMNQKKPDFKSVIENIFLGEQINLEEISENEAESFETITDTGADGKVENQQKNIYQKYYDEQFVENLDDNEVEMSEKEEGSEQMLVLNEDEYSENSDDDTRRSFNLKEAIIYSEILNRRYTN